MYSFETKLRYSQLDKNLKLSLNALINLFQDCSTFHSESIGQDLDSLYSKNQAWFVTAWQIELYNTPERFGDVRVSTWAHKFDKVLGYRNYSLTSPTADTVYVAANSFWSLVDLVENKPMRITDDIVNSFELDEPFPMEYLPRKLRIPKGDHNYTHTDTVPVVFAHLDSNNHVNNGQYIAIADSLLPQDFNYNRIRVEYRTSAVYGDIIFPKYFIENDICYMQLCDKNDNIYALVEFSTRNN